ncbi:transcriptional regulator [Paenibacillus sp. MZ04-78.2]|uniref:helix-turn-helix transcriptional regulator n=1 Tax=Paenibacillus sp. MZ04-78.2 TaxID=2962034 RepID=UPI0020B68641|nr:metalloregulator ArsR/SmtB family transcription factor [Paenibacillus sp. MZ04-78.2]MCP3774975.1 transcriptional regulator [Paenibacillus sp. MZ04-78.2]
MNIRSSHQEDRSTRRALLNLLKKRGKISVQEAAEQLGISGVAVRRHIHELQKDQYVQTNIQRQSAGRPTYLYSLTEKAGALFANGYDALVTDLIDEVKDKFGVNQVSRLFDRRKEKWLQKHEDSFQGLDLEKRVERLARLQEQEGYMVKVEKRGDGTFVFEEANCPIYQVAVRYRQACQCELSLFQALLAVPVVRTECMAEGGRKCQYRINSVQA